MLQNLFPLDLLEEVAMAVQPFVADHSENWELPVEELFRRAHLLPPYEETCIEDLTVEKDDAFVAALAE